MNSTLVSQLRFRQPTPDTRSGNSSPKSVNEIDRSKPFSHTTSKLPGQRKRFVVVDEPFAHDAESSASNKFAKVLRKNTAHSNNMLLFGAYRHFLLKTFAALMCTTLFVFFNFSYHNNHSKEIVRPLRNEILGARTRLIIRVKDMKNVTEQTKIQRSDNVTQQGELSTFTKPYRSLSYHDLNFKLYSLGAPSCEEKLDPENISFTLVTQVSEDRLWLITQNCLRWAPGHISVAVFTNKSVETLRGHFSQLEAKYGSCQPDQVKISVLSTNSYGKDNYPVNTLRNLALQQVKTSHIMYVDSDFFVSPNLFTVLHDIDVKKKLSEDFKLALVVPAFQVRQACKKQSSEYECRLDSVSRIPKDVDELIRMVIGHKATAFDPTNRGGHGSTSYLEWARMNPGDLRDIPCILSNRYEPYLAVRYCKDYPPYQEVFTGYGKNKMTQIMQMRHTGYVFSQVGGVFLCHYPHPEAASRESWKEGDQIRSLWIHNRTAAEEMYGPIDWTKYKRGQVDKIFIEFKKWLRNEVPETARTPIAGESYDDDVKLWLNDEDAPSRQRELLLHPSPEKKVCNKVTIK